MSFSGNKLDPSNIKRLNIGRALKLLKSYIGDFPEHDQVDFRVWKAMELLESGLADVKTGDK